MTPAELIHTVLCMNAKDMRPDWTQPGGPVVVQVEAGATPERIVDAFAGAGLAVVSAEDLRAYLYRSVDMTEDERAAMRRLRAALPEETSS